MIYKNSLRLVNGIPLGPLLPNPTGGGGGLDCIIIGILG